MAAQRGRKAGLRGHALAWATAQPACCWAASCSSAAWRCAPPACKRGQFQSKRTCSSSRCFTAMSCCAASTWPDSSAMAPSSTAHAASCGSGVGGSGRSTHMRWHTLTGGALAGRWRCMHCNRCEGWESFATSALKGQRPHPRRISGQASALRHAPQRTSAASESALRWSAACCSAFMRLVSAARLSAAFARSTSAVSASSWRLRGQHGAAGGKALRVRQVGAASLNRYQGHHQSKSRAV